MNVNGFTFDAEWKPDCAGKWDLDFSIIRVSTRYWRDFTARPSIYLGDKEVVRLPTGVYIRGDSEDDCKKKVEEFLKKRISEIINRLENS